MSFLKKILEKLMGSANSESVSRSVPADVKPALRFTNSKNVDGPPFVTFDDQQRQENGRISLILNLIALGTSKEGKERLRICLEALEQNEEFDCITVVNDSDYPELHTFSYELRAQFPSAFHRTLFAIENAAPQILLVDEVHNQAGNKGSEGAELYTLASTSNFLIDTRQYDFSKSLYPDISPNVIHIAIGGAQYLVAYDESKLTEISHKSLQAINENPPFRGFSAGESILIALGRQRIEGDAKQMVIKLLWLGRVNFGT